MSGLESCRTVVQGRGASYAHGGSGAPIVFLHGWGLGHRAYRGALHRLARKGAEVWAPALPGFGGTAELPGPAFSVAGYAAWVWDFLDEVGVTGPVTLVGHSFGGGVAIAAAHRRSEQTARLVCVNSIGGSSWTDDKGIARALVERPLWDWGLHLQADLLPWRQLSRVLPVVLEDAVPNLLRNPHTVWRVGQLARRCDLTAELAELRRRRVPVVVVWGKDDEVLPRGCMTSLCMALGDPEVITVDGSHSWLISDPRVFTEVLTNVVGLTLPDVA
jgi:pimeloyl-ACP methyl ester carboxylesterase